MLTTLAATFARVGTGHTRERTGAILPNAAPSNVYLTTDGLMILIAANQDSVFGRLADAMGRPELVTDLHFAARGAIVRRAPPELGEIPMQNVVPKLSKTPGEIRCAGQTLGGSQARCSAWSPSESPQDPDPYEFSRKETPG